MRVVPVPVLDDNYAYLLIDSAGKTAAIDPVEPKKLIAAAEKEGVEITAVITTHHHWDHAGGNVEMAKTYPNITVYGGQHDNVDGCNRPVADGEEFKFGNIDIKCMETPFHTHGHICYLCTEPGDEQKIVFTGDTLFVAGCGRMFAGTPPQMYGSLIEKLATLDGDTKMYCGHEYTVSNLKFAAHVDKENDAVKAKLAWAEEQRAKGLPTIPATIAEEKTYNPFLRCKTQEMAEYTGKTDPVLVLAELRYQKDKFVIVKDE